MSKDLLERNHECSELGTTVGPVSGSEHGIAAGSGPLQAVLHGEKFAKYMLVGEIAEGGMGELFLGVQQGPEGFSKVVVVKRLVGHLMKNEEFVQMFIDEARLGARLEHPNIVKTYEFGEHAGQYYTVMEFLAGEDLRRILNKLRTPPHRRLSLPLAVHIVAQICNGLHFAHELTDLQGKPLDLVHRDINPANVIVTYAGEVKIIDFGVAKVSTTTRQTVAGVIKGKIAYMSPEHILSRKVDRRSDVFSTGIILWEMLMGRPLFARDCDAATMYAVMNDPIPRPSRERPEIPPALDAIVARALARTPGERFATAEDMRVALDQIAATLPRCDGHTIGWMMEKVFGTTRAQAKRAITQSRSLAHNVSLVMKKTTATLPIFAPPTTSSSTSALPVVALPTIAIPKARRRRWLVIDSAIASLCGVAAIFAFGSWVDTGSPSTALSPPRLGAPIEGAAVPGGAQVLAAASPASPPRAVPPHAPQRPRPVAGPPGQGTLTVDTYPNALVYLDGKTLEHGSLEHRPMATGPHELVVKLPGRPAVRRSISIAADRETRLKIEVVQQAAGEALAIAATTPPAPAHAASSSSRPGAQPAGKAPRRTQAPGSSVKSAPSPRNPATPAATEAGLKDPIAEASAPPAVQSPGLDVKAIRAAVRSQIGALRQCYERAKMDDGNLHGQVTAHITVAADGTVANVQISHSTLNAPQVEGCISREITRWQLPRPSGGGTVAFLYPFVFE